MAIAYPVIANIVISNIRYNELIFTAREIQFGYNTCCSEFPYNEYSLQRTDFDSPVKFVIA